MLTLHVPVSDLVEEQQLEEEAEDAGLGVRALITLHLHEVVQRHLTHTYPTTSMLSITACGRYLWPRVCPLCRTCSAFLPPL